MSLCCDNLQVDAVLTVDDRGQMVLPKEIRQRAGISPGDKLAVVSYEKDGSVCCLWLMKTDLLLGSVRSTLAPLMSALARRETEGETP